MRMKRFAAFVAAAVMLTTGAAAVRAQTPADSALFSLDQLQADFRQLREAMEENASVIYLFTDKAAYDSLFDRQYALITRSMSVEEFRRVMVPVVTQAGCMHTSLWMPPGYWKSADAKLIPLRPVILGGTCYVWRPCPQAEQIRAGSEIVAIDGEPIADILAKLKANVSADGYNDSYRSFKMNEGFVYRYALDYGFHDTFEFAYRLPGETETRIAVVEAVDAKTADEYSLGKNSTEGNSLDYTHRFEVLPDSATMILTARSFAFYEHPETFNGFIDSAFTAVQELDIRNLVLDLRNNNGGNPFCAAHLLSYLEPEPLVYFAEEYGKYASLAHPVPRAGNPFTGALYILTNGNNVSTTPHFLSVLRYHDIGTFVGTETGGTYTCNAATQNVHLDNTKFIVSLATGSFAAAVEGFPKTRGIVPDTTVVSTIDDLLERRDVQKEFVLRLIRNGR